MMALKCGRLHSVPEEAIKVAAKVAGFLPSSGELHITYLGGGFGRRLNSDFVSQAVQIAKTVKGTPIKLVWTREETMQHSFYRPTSLTRIRGGIDSDGTWYRLGLSVSPLTLPGGPYATYDADTLLHAIPNMLVERTVTETHVPKGQCAQQGLG